MKINLFVIDNSVQNNLVGFFMSIKKIELVFQNISLLNNFKNDNNLILFPPETKKNHFIKSIKKFQLCKLTSLCYLVPVFFLKEMKNNNIKSIVYPIKINNFPELVCLKNSAKFFPIIKNMSYLDTWITTRIILPNKEENDADLVD